MHYYCQCLNITIDTLAIDENQPTNFLSFANLSEEWFECNLLSEKSIHIVWQSFLQSINVRDMKLNRCLVCNQYTHITNNESNRILINKELLLCHDKPIEECYKDPNYSKIIKIILPNGLNNSPMARSPTFQDEIFQREYEFIQQIYRQSLEDADRETEEKIRIYQQEQEQLLQRKIKAINKEFETFLNLIRSMSRQTSPILQTSISYINENSMESGFGSDILDVNGAESSRQSSMIERAFSERSDNLDEDPLLDNTDWYNGKDSSSNYATSLPKEIAFHAYSIPQPNDAENNDLERIGKSFRELSQSLMCTDGTEVFGDLPSPRLNATQT